MALQAAAERGSVTGHPLDRETDVARVLEAGRRRLDASAPPQQERRSQAVLELCDAVADRGGLDVFMVCRPRHALVVANRDQQPQGPEVDVSHGRDDPSFQTFLAGNLTVPNYHWSEFPECLKLHTFATPKWLWPLSGKLDWATASGASLDVGDLNRPRKRLLSGGQFDAHEIRSASSRARRVATGTDGTRPGS
jgi:hypothetical protein